MFERDVLLWLSFVVWLITIEGRRSPMKRKSQVMVLAAMLLVGVATGAFAQQPTSQIWEVVDVEIKPGMSAQYEAAVLERNAWREEGGYPFGMQAFRANLYHYRFITYVGDWAGVERSRRWFEPFLAAGVPPDFLEPLQSATVKLSRSYIRTRPDLVYVPEGQTFAETFTEAGYVHEIRLFPKPGMTRAYTEAQAAFIPLYADSNVQLVRGAWSVWAGANVPEQSLFFPAESALAFWEELNAGIERMGPEFRRLQREVLIPTVRNVEIWAWEKRDDLNYQP